jgi:hypothetical protein
MAFSLSEGFVVIGYWLLVIGLWLVAKSLGSWGDKIIRMIIKTSLPLLITDYDRLTASLHRFC